MSFHPAGQLLVSNGFWRAAFILKVCVQTKLENNKSTLTFRFIQTRTVMFLNSFPSYIPTNVELSMRLPSNDGGTLTPASRVGLKFGFLLEGRTFLSDLFRKECFLCLFTDLSTDANCTCSSCFQMPTQMRT